MRNANKSGFRISAALVIGLAGYGTATAQPSTQAQPPAAHGQAAGPQCPTVMRGVKITTQDVKNGVALTLITPRPDQVVELRDQLQQAAVVIENHSKAAAAHASAQVESDEATLPPVDITVSDIKSGARVLVRPVRTEDLPNIRELAQGFKQAWDSSECSKPTAKP